MIAHITITVSCDRSPTCKREEIHQDGPDVDSELLAFARRVMADHRAQLPSEARDLYGGGCGCPQCEQARAAIAKAEGRA